MASSKKMQKGLGASFFDIQNDNLVFAAKNGPTTLRIADIEPRSDQPRKQFEREPLEALAESIGKYGVLQPIIVRASAALAGSYEIIAGERRWRAAKMAGLSEIPVVILEGDELKAAQVSIIENIQREDLNPYEEAAAYRALMDEYDLSQEEISIQVGKSRSAVANALRLLDLPNEVVEMLVSGMLSAGHGRALLGLKNKAEIVPLAERIVARNLSVREVEALVKSANRRKVSDDEDDSPKHVNVNYFRSLESRFTNATGRRCRITDTKNKKTFQIEYRDNEDLEDILKKLAGNGIFDEY